MKFLPTAFIITLTAIYGCKSQDKMVFSSQDVVKEEEKTEVDYETIEIEKVLGTSKWNHISDTKSVYIYRIDSLLIDPEKNEYGRKLVKIDSLNSENVASFLETIKNKNNYPVLSNDKTGFNPSHLFELCADTCEMSLMLDSKDNKLGFINLQGQEIITLSKDLKNYLKTILIKD